MRYSLLKLRFIQTDFAVLGNKGIEAFGLLTAGGVVVSDRCPYKGCSDICVNYVSGPVCLCREGYKLNSNGLTCSGKTLFCNSNHCNY